jgi:hypothetical protein
MTTALVPFPTPGLVPARLFAPTPKAAKRVVGREGKDLSSTSLQCIARAANCKRRLLGISMLF